MRKKLTNKLLTAGVIAILLLGQVKPVHATHVDTHAFCPPHRVWITRTTYLGQMEVNDGQHYVIINGVTKPCNYVDVYDNYRIEYRCRICGTYTYIENESVFIYQRHSVDH